MNGSNTCPKCQGSMVEGAMVDQGYGQSFVAAWQEGAPNVSRWFGLKVRRKQLVPTRALRCNRCSYLELYAPPVVR